MKVEHDQQIRDNKWCKAGPCLYRYVPSGVYFARIRVGGKLIQRSLRTKGFSVAKTKLANLEKEERRRDEIQQAPDTGKMTFADALRIYRERLKGDVSLKPRSKVYREECIGRLLRTWPELEANDVRRISKADCLSWSARLAGKASATSYNNTVGTLRLIVDVAVEAGIRYDNPVRFIKRAKVRTKPPALPSQAQFLKLVEAIENSGRCACHQAAALVRFLAFTGCRKSEAARVTWADCDFDAGNGQGEIVVRGDPETGTKNGDIRRVPMIPELRKLLLKWRAVREEEPPTAIVMKVRECQVSLDRAAQAVGCPRITHHDLRHLFTTRCIESGVDIPTVSRWLGHKDGGALLMKTYGHLRNHHSLNMAQRVSFDTPAATNVTPLPADKVA